MSYKLIKEPNLPQNTVKHCLIGRRYTEEIKELESLGLTCLALTENKHLDDEVNCHSDMLCCNLGKGEILISHGAIGENELNKIVFKAKLINDIESPYPKDIALNCAIINNKYICNEKFINPLIKEYALNNGGQIIHTKQGYSRCNLCIVNEKAVITEDIGLACLLKKYQFDVLQISAGDVYLSNNHNGFLGGASGKVSEKEIYFSGDLSTHKDYQNILNFLNKHNVKPIYNKFRKLRDFGGFIQLTEIL